MCSDFGLPLGGGESVVTPTNPHVSATDSASTTADAEDLLLLPTIKIGKNAKDITGQRFGRLVALRPVGRTKKSQIKWLCACDCGGHVAVIAAALLLRTGTRSCGCLWPEKCHRPYRELAGQRFGRLLVIERTETVGSGGFLWRCRCDCGEYCDVSGGSLVDGSTKSCGCLKLENSRAQLAVINESGRIRGANHYHWNPDLTPEEREHKRPDAYHSRKTVLWRDDYTCLCCGKRGGDHNAHHMLPWAKDKSARYDPDNLVLLCVSCHKAYHHAHQFSETDEQSFVAWLREQKLKQKIIVDTAPPV